MGKKKKLLLVAALAASFAAPALAQERGGFLGLTAGRVDYKDFCDALTGVSCDNSDTAWRFFGGYRFSRNGALELGYANLGAASASGAAGASARYEVTAWDLSGTLSAPMSPMFAFFGKLGLYHADVDSRGTIPPFTTANSKKNSGLTYGLGAQFSFTRTLAARAEYQIYSAVGDSTTREDDLGVFSAGIVWKFQ